MVFRHGRSIKKIKQLNNVQDEKVKLLHCDQGSEFLNEKLKGFAKEQGIQFELSNAYVPQQNGTAERNNRTSMDGVRSMLYGNKLALTLWSYALKSKVFLLNRTPCKKNKEMIIPYEKFWNRKVSLGKLRIFGSTGWEKD